MGEEIGRNHLVREGAVTMQGRVYFYAISAVLMWSTTAALVKSLLTENTDVRGALCEQSRGRALSHRHAARA